MCAGSFHAQPEGTWWCDTGVDTATGPMFPIQGNPDRHDCLSGHTKNAALVLESTTPPSFAQRIRLSRFLVPL